MKCLPRRVTKVIDGDTFRINSPISGSRYIRLAGMDAPEKGQFGFSQAKRDLERMLLGRRVCLEPVAKSYGRTVAKVRKLL